MKKIILGVVLGILVSSGIAFAGAGLPKSVGPAYFKNAQSDAQSTLINITQDRWVTRFVDGKNTCYVYFNQASTAISCLK